MVRLVPSERLRPHGPVRVERAVKLLPVGAISITVKVPFAVERLEDLVEYHDLQFNESYRDLRAPSLRRRVDTLDDLRELRVDLARCSDETSNITKFFGDWHLARIYEHLSARFHLADWHRAVDEKLRTLDNLYQLIKHDQTNRWMLILKTTIVLLFIIDLVVLFLGFKGQ